MIEKMILLFCLVILATSVAGEEKYSFEKAEELTPLIEWRDYGPPAFEEAINQNKPIFLLLTAPSWCYWCQVYESEDYLFHPDMVKMLNENFIPIYVDADKRQDLTRQILEGGWPSTTVMTPGRERLYGFSGPRPVPNMLANLQGAIEHVKTSGFSNKVMHEYKKKEGNVPSQEELVRISSNFALYTLQTFDPEHGGFGTGQKFPQGRTLDFTLDVYEFTGEKQYLELVQKTLRGQYTKLDELKTNYNLFDPVEGGFHRYGTQRDWTPPHYEKMLYDNARLLKAYMHLVQVDPQNQLAKEVVEKTIAYIRRNWYDPEGGFYSNTDVHGEDVYHDKNPRPLPRPRVEETKYTNWNAEAVITYLYLWKTTNEEEYKDMAVNSLQFLSSEMMSDQGAYHFITPDGEKGVRGTLLDNSYLLLAFVEAYEVLGDEKYLTTAERIAGYSLENLYDWYGGGFFERNSPDKNLYPPGEHIVLEKAEEENGLIGYALLKLYSHTNKAIYLGTGLKTIGSGLSQAGGLDRGYYFAKAAQLILEKSLLSDFAKVQEHFQSVELERQKDFWLDDIAVAPVERKFHVSDEGADTLGGPLGILLLIALFAGLLSFLSPCTLPILPAFVTYSFRSSRKNIARMTVSFFLGLSLLFVVLGMSATALGGFLQNNLTSFSQIAGVILILFGVFMLSGKGFSGFSVQKRKPGTYLESFLFGAALGLSWTPCVGPILVAILVVASTSSSAFTGGLLLFMYAVGLALPLVLISLYVKKIDYHSQLWRILKGKEVSIFGWKIHTNSLIPGLLFILLGYLMFSGTLYTFNQYIVSSSLQKWMFGLEEKLLSWVR